MSLRLTHIFQWPVVLLVRTAFCVGHGPLYLCVRLLWKPSGAIEASRTFFTRQLSHDAVPRITRTRNWRLHL